MSIKHFVLLSILFLSSSVLAQKSYKKIYSLSFSGVVTDKDSKPIPSAPIIIRFKAEPITFSKTMVDTIKTDSLGNYSIELKKKGSYNISYTAPKMISYNTEVYYNEKTQNGLAKRIYEAPLNVQLYPQTKNIKTDIYNGGKWTPRSGKLLFVEHKKYLQAHDYKVRKGFKTTAKASKYVAKKIKKLQLKKILAIVSLRSEIDTIITSDSHLPEIRERWMLFFGKKSEDYDKQRLEYIQDFYEKISTTDPEGNLLYSYKGHSLDLTKTVMADDTKEVFQLYNFRFNNSSGKDLSFDVMFIKTHSGWKINYITENYL